MKRRKIKSKIKWLVFLGWCYLSIVSCASIEPPPLIEIHPSDIAKTEPLPKEEPSADALALKRLEKIAPEKSYKAQLVSDLSNQLKNRSVSGPILREEISDAQLSEWFKREGVGDLSTLNSYSKFKLGSSLCRAIKKENPLNPLNILKLKAWKKLNSKDRRLLKAQILFCTDQTDDARSIVDALWSESKLRSFERYLLGTYYVDFLRATGDRQKMAEVYLSSSLNPPNAEELAREKQYSLYDARYELLNNDIWAVRYLGLIGDFKNAEDLSARILREVERLLDDKKLRTTQKSALKEFRVEVFQTIATRIKFDKGDPDATVAFLLLALDSAIEMPEWQGKLGWLIGIYYYVAGEYAHARRYWEDLLQTQPSKDSEKSRLLFWLAKSCKRLGKIAESNEYLKQLTQQYPLSFYATVGMNEDFSDSNLRWSNPFLQLQGQNPNLVAKERFDLDRLRKEEQIAAPLLRAEIAVAAQVDRTLAKPIIDQLLRTLRKRRKKIDESTYERALIYISRLYFGISAFREGLTTTIEAAENDLSFWERWPDQVFVYFPAPYTDFISKHGQKMGIDGSLIYGLARQESSFEPSAISPAGAVGLLQLMPATAMKQAQKQRLEKELLSLGLANPYLNIKLSMNYVRELDQRYGKNQPALYAAYNAGEYVVDSWIETRKTEDRILWVELIPFGETLTYVKNVWRNQLLYSFLRDEVKTGWALQFDHLN